MYSRHPQCPDLSGFVNGKIRTPLRGDQEGPYAPGVSSVSLPCTRSGNFNSIASFGIAFSLTPNSWDSTIAFAAELARAWLLNTANAFLTPGVLMAVLCARLFFWSQPGVEIIVAFPRLRMFPPCLCISAMRSEVKYIADWFKLLSDGNRKLRFVDNGLARSILFEKPIRLGAILLQLLCRSSTTFG